MIVMLPIEIVRESVTWSHVRDLAEAGFGDLVKAVVDIELGIMAVGGDMHADEEATLLDLGSRQDHLWGINLYLAEHGGPGWVEFDSMINLRPRLGNRSRCVDDPAIRERILEIVDQLVAP